MTELKTGEAIIKTLKTNGIDTIYCLPGLQNDHFFNALYDVGEGIRVIHTRHEQGAGYMALGAAQATGEPQTCSVVPGVGLFNAMASLATAYSVNAPVLFLSGQIPSHLIGRGFGALHEVPDQLSVLQSQTKWATRIDRASDAPRLVNEAFSTMMSGRIRPVALECAMDVLPKSEDVTLLPAAEPQPAPALDEDAIADLAKMLGEAENPMIVVGGGAQHASEEVRVLAETLQAAVVAFRMGQGVLDARHELYVSMPVAHTLWPKVDVVLGIGTRLVPQLTQWGRDEDLKVARIDIDPEEIGRLGEIDAAIVGDSREAIRALIDGLAKTNRKRSSRKEELDQARAEIADTFGVIEEQLSWLATMRNALGEDGIFVEELTHLGYFSRFAYPVYKPRTFISSGYQGTLGGGFATALGVKAARPDVPVLSIAGDGGFLFTASEFATAVRHRIGLVTVVFTNNAYGNVRSMQKNVHGNRLIATDLANPDFVKFAESFGGVGRRANTPAELAVVLEESFKADVPTIVEVPIHDLTGKWEAFLYRGKARG